MSMTQQERELLDASQVIGGICEKSQWASSEIADLVALTGKPVGDLTITELMRIVRERDEQLRNRFAEPEKN